MRWLLAVSLVLGACGGGGFVTPEPPAPDTESVRSVRVNQVGYLVHGPKHATVESDATEVLPWCLLSGGADSAEVPVAEGTSVPFGFDADSGRHVHRADFSDVREEGDGYRLVVAGVSSPEFAIAPEVYGDLETDALRFFFHNRSGLAIEMPFAGDQRWVRPAGHAGSDRSATCFDPVDCTYRLDISGGWYDAGDHGKYVVNAGISVWTLMNLYETLPHAIGDDVGIPESGNGVSDLLDEVRWELEFMLRMQVPEGGTNAGMVHHKIHDDKWTPVPIAPHEAEKRAERFLHPVSTAATLNLAASTAQAARIWRDIDPEFSKRCLDAAERALRAAQDRPNAYARWSRDATGGGAYADDDMSDEFFWAASELWITTRRPEYEEDTKESPFWTEMTASVGGLPTAMTWNRVDALGTLSLLAAEWTYPAAPYLSPQEREAQRQKLVRVADRLLALVESQGYGLPFASDAEGDYPWGSNSFVLNNLIVLATARRETGSDRYLDAMVQGLDYLFGRNPLGQSYVTGYGDRPLKNPHHRAWAHQIDPNYPEPPPGAASGGPNSRLQDPYVRALAGEKSLEGCPPQTCFVDHVEAFSVNEVAINWNAPLVWVVAYVDREEVWLQALAVLE